MHALYSQEMIIVTGGAGFIGSAFVRKLNNEGVSDIWVVDHLAHSHKWKNLVRKSFVEYLDKRTFLDLVKGGALPASIEAIVHLGACSATTESDADYLLENNYQYTRTLAEYALQRNIRFIYASSAATYGDGSQGYDDDLSTLESLRPLNGYGFSKHLFDLWALRHGHFQNIAGLKFFNVYGPNEYYKGEMSSVVWKAYNKIEASGSFQLFKSYLPQYADGEQKRDFIYVKDCCDVLWWLVKNPSANGLFNLGTGTARTWKDLVTGVFAALGRTPNIDFIEMPVELRNHYQYFTEARMTRLAAAGYSGRFHSLEEGITDYVQGHLCKTDPHF